MLSDCDNDKDDDKDGDHNADKTQQPLDKRSQLY